MRPIPEAALVALQLVRDDRAAARRPGPVVLCFDDAPGAPRESEWSVIADGVVQASSQPHRIGKRRTI